jgi:CHAT domain-containing protein
MSNTADLGKKKQEPDLEDVLLIGNVFYDYNAENKKEIAEDRGYSIMQSEFLLGEEENKNKNGSKNIWLRLPGTLAEIYNIKALLPKSSILQEKEATETAFKNLSGNSPSVIHIATHGYYFSDLEKKKESGPTLWEKPYVHAKNPLLRSGLILANANYAWQKGANPYEKDDGILTALEISNMDLKNTDIVILSACETGLGDVPSSEGVYGLQRAFKMAGVETIIMALWNLKDITTKEYMTLFYNNWKSSNDPKAAFKKAQKTMMTKYREEPKKWAALVYLE